MFSQLQNLRNYKKKSKEKEKHYQVFNKKFTLVGKRKKDTKNVKKYTRRYSINKIYNITYVILYML